MRKFKSSLLRLIPIISFVLFSLFTNGQNQLNGLWKSIYVTSYSIADTGIQYTRILLDIEDSIATLKNFDGIFKEKQIFTNSGKIDQKNKQLIFQQNTDKEKIYDIVTEGDYLKFNLSENPKEEITLKNLAPSNLDINITSLQEILTTNTISGDFSYYDEFMEIQFNADSSMLVTNSLKGYLSVLDKWALLTFGNELFLYLSDFGPMVHIDNISEGQMDFSDEYDKTYKGSFKISESIPEFNKEELIGIWEQEKADTTGISAIPEIMYDKDYYVKEIWEYTDQQATKYSQFFVRKSPWKTSRNNEILILESMDDRRFRILLLDEDKLVVERMNRYGEVYEDTFHRKKSVPKPSTLGKYLK